MFKAVKNLRDEKGFTLIELLIVVAIIGILAAIAIPGYLGMQERSRKGAVQRAAGSSESEIQAWLQSARKGGGLTEVDSDGNGIVNNSDANNSTLALWLTTADSLCYAYVSAKFKTNDEFSPWDGTQSLWITGAATNGRINCQHAAGGSTVSIDVRDKVNERLYDKVISAD